MKTELPKYVTESALNVLHVLEALEGTEFEPVSLERIVERTKHANLSRNKCFRALHTLQAKGYAKQDERGFWSITPRILRFSERYADLLDKAV